MDFEYEVRLKDGRTVSVVGTVELIDHCDCAGELHWHIEDMEIESAIVVSGGEEWIELDRNGRAWAELECKVEQLAYAEVAA